MPEKDPRPIRLTKNFYCVDEVAEYFNVSIKTVSRLIEEKA